MSFHIIMLPALAGFVVSLLVAYYAWRIHSNGSRVFASVMLAVALWSLGNALESASHGFDQIVFWAQFQYFGIVTVPGLTFIFSLLYVGRITWVKSRVTLLLAVLPIATLVLVWTNQHHGLIWSNLWLDHSGPIPLLDSVHGTAFWIHTAYSYTLLVSATAMLAAELLRRPRVYRRQAVALIVGLILPFAANAVFVFSVTTLPKIDTTPFLFTITGAIIGFGFFRLGFLDIAPIARNAVFDNMRDAVVVVDPGDRIVDLNDAALALAAGSEREVIGMSVTAAFPDILPPLHEILNTSDCSGARADLTFERDGVRRYLDLHISPVPGRRGAVIGRVLNAYDITERVETEQALLRSESDNQALIEAIPDVIARIRPDGTLLDLYSPTHYSLPGLRDEIVGLNLYELSKRIPVDVPDEVIDGSMSVIRRAIATGETETFEFEISIDGSLRSYETRAVVSRDDEAIAMVRDVTDRKLAQELRENQTMITEIHHRVKNNLQVVSSLLRLQSQDVEDPRIQQMFDDSVHRVQTMALIHEQLYQSEAPNGINLAAYIRELVSNLVGSFGASEHETDLELERVFIDLNKATPCGLLVHEIVSNSLKHAFPGDRTGTIRITLQAGEYVTLTIEDDGVGMPEPPREPISGTIGLSIIEALAGQIDATMNVDGTAGTKYVITFET